MEFIQLTFIDVIDILMVAFILYQVYQLIRGTAAINIFVAVIMVYFLYLFVKVLKMELMTLILGKFIGVGVLALIILFQQEIRRFLLHIGTNYMRRSHNSLIKWLFYEKNGSNTGQTDSEHIVDACANMSKSKTGALIVLGNKSALELVAGTGDIIDAVINTRLLQNIFFKNSPLHDGAVIIINNRIYATRCILPSSENPNIPAYFGMRHRAAIGISEVTDAVALVVSEETGRISYIKGGNVETNLSIERLKSILENKY